MSRDPAYDADEVRALLRWAAAEGVGLRRLRRAVEIAGSGRALLGLAHADDLLGPGARPAPAADAEGVLRACEAAGVRPLAWSDPAYPPALLHLDDPPPVLFVRGALPDPDRRAVALVGSRRAGAYGRGVARSLGRALGRRGVPVLSGMALGIDGEAHAGALEGGGPTVAVLGGGVDRARPSAHRRLYRDILERGGGVVGEWAPGTPARPFHFPRRNRILAALVHTVVVVEAGDRSGALSTAAHARRLGRDVAAVPGPIDRPGHRGSNRLIRDGCAPILEVRDVLDLVGVVDEGASVPAPGPSLTGDDGPVWRALESGPVALETLAERVGLPVARVLGAVTRLEAEGWVQRVRGLHARAAGGVRS